MGKVQKYLFRVEALQWKEDLIFNISKEICTIFTFTSIMPNVSNPISSGVRTSHSYSPYLLPDKAEDSQVFPPQHI